MFNLPGSMSSALQKTGINSLLLLWAFYCRNSKFIWSMPKSGTWSAALGKVLSEEDNTWHTTSPKKIVSTYDDRVYYMVHSVIRSSFHRPSCSLHFEAWHILLWRSFGVPSLAQDGTLDFTWPHSGIPDVNSVRDMSRECLNLTQCYSTRNDTDVQDQVQLREIFWQWWQHSFWFGCTMRASKPVGFECKCCSQSQITLLFWIVCTICLSCCIEQNGKFLVKCPSATFHMEFHLWKMLKSHNSQKEHTSQKFWIKHAWKCCLVIARNMLLDENWMKMQKFKLFVA